MPKVKKTRQTRKLRPALTPEARENQLIALAYDLAEQQLLDGSASSQVITELIKSGSTRRRLEKQKLETEIELLQAKTESIQSAQHVEELYKNAIDAMQVYNGSKNVNE